MSMFHKRKEWEGFPVGPMNTKTNPQPADDDLVDAVLRSLDHTRRLAGIANPSYVKPIVAELVQRVREFGYADDAIFAMLVKER